ncbi:TPA: hypothetical protein JZG45_005400 [Escherichia coli]|nr:hypothetical protein [Escherichia coli]
MNRVNGFNGSVPETGTMLSPFYSRSRHLHAGSIFLGCDDNDDNSAVLLHPEHHIATHPKAKHNPVLAFRLIQSGTPFSEADEKLNNSPRMLSRFTFRFMEERTSGWELFTDAERNEMAFARSVSHNDDNGYHASLRAAHNALQRFVIWPSFPELVRQAKALYDERHQAQADAEKQRIQRIYESAGFTWTPTADEKNQDGEVNKDPQYTGVYFRDPGTGR